MFLHIISRDGRVRSRPVVAYLEDKVPRRRGQFRFDKRWIGHEGLMDSIAIGWSENHRGSAEDIVTN